MVIANSPDASFSRQIGCFSVVEARNIKRGGEFMWVDMLLLDVNDC